jgi:hypothetical protein
MKRPQVHSEPFTVMMKTCIILPSAAAAARDQSCTDPWVQLVSLWLTQFWGTWLSLSVPFHWPSLPHAHHTSEQVVGSLVMTERGPCLVKGSLERDNDARMWIPWLFLARFATRDYSVPRSRGRQLQRSCRYSDGTLLAFDFVNIQ